VNKTNIGNSPLIKKIALVNIFIYPVWLVVYLILHENNAYFGLIPIRVSLNIFFYYFIFVVVASLGLNYLFKSPAKAFLFTTLLVAVSLFFGSIQDFTKELPVPDLFKKYRFLLSFIILFTLAAFIFLQRSKKAFQHLGQYIRLTIAILVIWEFAYVVINTVSGKAGENVLIERSQQIPLLPAAATPNAPDIYFIVFDAFTSSQCLQEEFGYNNTELDSFLYRNGFYIVTHSKSNYPATPFSIASTLNFSYLADTINNRLLTAKYMLQGQETVAHNRLIPYLKAKGYKIVNHSIFDIKGYPAVSNAYFDDLQEKLITQQTLPGRIQKQVMWNFTSKEELARKRSEYLQDFVYDKMSGLKAAAAAKEAKPKFVYCHFMVPHEPYYFNKDGTLNNDPISADGRFLKIHYLDQLIYSRQLVKKAIKTIMDKDTLNKIIIVEGDHGYRDFAPDKSSKYFDNLNAIYFYDKNYSALRDSMTPVNTFRVILNQYFHERLPYLTDTCIYVHDPSFGQYK
jgi:hypothetical protein